MQWVVAPLPEQYSKCKQSWDRVQRVMGHSIGFPVKSCDLVWNGKRSERVMERRTIRTHCKLYGMESAQKGSRGGALHTHTHKGTHIDGGSMHAQVRQDANGMFKVDGLTDTPCRSAAAALKAISFALQWRHTRAHAMNEYSSRSHCLMTFNFSSEEKAEEGGEQGAKGGVRRWVACLKL